MNKVGNKTRDLSFMSAKNGRMMTVHTEQAMQYAMLLEKDPNVISYITNHPLELDEIETEQGIRKTYYETQWASDFVITFADCTTGIRELVTASKLTKRSEIEKLQLSHSYWQKTTTNWKIVITQ